MNRKAIWIFMLSLLMLSGCFGRKSVMQKYYLLELPAVADSVHEKTQSKTSATCGIAEVKVADAFASSRIALRTNTHELRYYSYHKWAVRPGIVLSQLVEQYLQEQRIFAFTSNRNLKRLPDYELYTEVKHLEVVERDDALAAHLNIEFQLVDNSSGEILLRHKADSRNPLAEKKLNLFTATIGEIVHNELQVLSQKIISYLESTEKSS